MASRKLMKLIDILKGRMEEKTIMPLISKLSFIRYIIGTTKEKDIIKFLKQQETFENFMTIVKLFIANNNDRSKETDMSMVTEIYDDLSGVKDSVEISEMVKFVNSSSYDILKSAIFTDIKLEDATPLDICRLVYALLDPKTDIVDICSGSGTFLFYCAEQNKDLSVYGTELSKEKYLISKMRAYMSGVHGNLEHGDVFTSDSKKISDTTFKKSDAIFSHFPLKFEISMSAVARIGCDKWTKLSIDIGSKSNGNWLFPALIINMLSERGKGICIMPLTDLSAMTSKNIREQLICGGYIEGVIKLPGKMFGSDMPQCALLVLSNNNDKIRMLDASGYCHEEKKGTEIDIDLILQAYNANDSKNAKCGSFDLATFEKNDFNLIPQKYTKKEEISVELPCKMSDLLDNTTEKGGIFRAQSITANVLENDDGNMEYRVLKSSDISEYGTVSEELPYVKIKDNKYDKYLLKDGDLIFTYKSTIVKVAVVDVKGSEKILPFGGMLVVRPDKTKVDPYYLKAFFDSNIGKRVINSVKTGTSVININPKQLMEASVTLKSIQEQKKISNSYRKNLKLIDVTKSYLKRLEKNLAEVFENDHIETA